MSESREFQLEMEESVESIAQNDAELTGDFKSNDITLLRSRVDEQSKLICFLKRRADDQMEENRELSSRFEDLAISKEDGDNDIRMLRHHCEMLESRFDELAENHDEMIKIKDEYKARCKELTEENKRLEEENQKIFSERLNSKEAEIKDMKSKLKTAIEKYDNLFAEHDTVLKKFQESKESMTAENKRIFQELCQTRVSLEKAEQNIADSSNNHQGSLSKESEKYKLLLGEKQELLQEVMSRGKLVQEKQNIIENLQSRVSSQESEMSKIKEEYSQKEHHLSVNKRISALMREKEEAIKSYTSLKMEYKALRDHSNMLLAKEKDLNKLLSCGRRNKHNSSIPAS